jgi:GDP/UDP-N,N'-diacetylbacillosamine 2-epimerase (hydrolysing)
MRHVAYVSGTRADFGLVRKLLVDTQAAGLRISVCATGMHLDPRYGRTVREIEAAGLHIAARIPSHGARSTGADMALGIAQQLKGLIRAWRRERPDLVLVLGDRGEMLAGAIAALHLNIPIAHLHGGERSGSIDEPVRHAISKLSHYHFVSTASARKRLVRMGERADCVFVTGAPSLDGIVAQATKPRAELCLKFQLDPGRPIAVLLFHPVVQSAARAGRESSMLVRAVLRRKLQVLWLLPNSDAGSDAIRRVARAHAKSVRIVTHLPRADYLAWLAAAEVLVGNSSSGIVEAASFGLPVVNVGDRQNLRDRNRNVIDTAARPAAIDRALGLALSRGRRKYRNIYTSGDAGRRIIRLLRTVPLDGTILRKANTY